MSLILTILFMFTGCNKEEVKQQENLILGQWSLIKFEPGFSPTENFSVMVKVILGCFKHTNIY